MIVPPRPQNVCGVNDEGSYSHNPFDFGAWLRFDTAAVTKIKISPEILSAPLPQLIG
jgi:hypothetical protein